MFDLFLGVPISEIGIDHPLFFRLVLSILLVLYFEIRLFVASYLLFKYEITILEALQVWLWKERTEIRTYENRCSVYPCPNRRARLVQGGFTPQQADVLVRAAADQANDERKRKRYFFG